jgi:low temperature requirement protein LtrA
VSVRIRLPMASRDPQESHRVATPLELFFDLTFVVAVAQAAATLHHGLAGGHATDVLIGFPLAFFGLWWAWMNFTWFASAYDVDDAVYRLAVLVQMAGVLVYAAGVPRAMEHGDFHLGVTGYVIMRIGLLAHWLRAARSDPDRRACCLRYAVGIAVCQVYWIVLVFALPQDVLVPGFVLGALAEIAVPMWAERAGATSWHPHHIAERYGLFTIIVLGETVLAATLAVQGALDAGDSFDDLVTVAVGGLLVVFSMWWIYFDQPAHHVVDRAREAMTEGTGGNFLWGYGHFLVFLGAAATGAGIALAVDQATGRSELSDGLAGLVVTVPVSAYVLTVWALNARAKRPGPMRSYACPVTVGLIGLLSLLGEPVLTTGLVLAGLVAVIVIVGERDGDRLPHPG